MFNKIKEKFFGGGEDTESTLIWKHDYAKDKPNREMIYRFPNSQYPDFSEIEYVGVREYEVALYYQNGKYVGKLIGGHYKIEDEAKTSATEVVWFDPGIVKLLWGVSHSTGVPPRTSDGFVLGASGDLSIQIDDPEALITNVITGQPNFKDDDFKDLIRSILTTSFRDVVNTYDLKDFLIGDREGFNDRMKTVLADQFRRYGVSIDSMNVLNVTHPPEDQVRVQQIMDTDRDQKMNQNSSIREEIESKEAQLKTLKGKMEDMEMNYALGEVEEEEFTKRMPLIKKLVKQREAEIKELRSKF